eukprot:TRINITY_DN525_c0_g5_i1.p1 TRINITY_DN525_c0_g5~~TRINITY_DN525_c0_g5_i1.p1  ORF type:complete len:252 (+),score=62.57 TRINITY_DN525_c0_g5_i1:103-858(+)
MSKKKKGGFFKKFLNKKHSDSSSSSSKLKTKNCIIIGAHTPVGRQLAKMVVQEMNHVGLVSESGENIDSLMRELNQIKNNNQILVPAEYNVEDGISSAEQLVNTITEEISEIHIFFFVLEQPMHSKFSDITNVPKVTKRLMDINYLSGVYCTQILLPHLRKTKGNICVLSAISSETHREHVSIYCAARCALHGFLETVKIEESDINVTVILDTNTQKQIVNADGGFDDVDVSDLNESAESTAQKLLNRAKK